MEAKTVRKGEILAKKGTSADVLWYIADGTVHMKVGKAAVPLTKGDLIGLADIQSGIHSCDYVAATDIQVSVFATRENLHKTDFLSSRPDNCRAIALSINGVVCNLFKSLGELNSSLFKMLRITHKAYETYCNYAAFLHTTPQEIEEMEFLPKEEASDIRQSAVSRMHAGMHALLSGKESGQNLVEYHVVPGYILHCSSDIMDLCPQVEAASDMISQCLDICMNESGDDIYDRLLRLYMRATSDHQLADPIKTLLDEIYEAVFEIDPRIAEIRKAASDVKISQEKAKASSAGKADRDIAAKLAGSMDTILEFANYPSDKASEIRKAIGDFKKISDPMSTEDDVRQLRMTIEENFYQLYIAVLEERIKAKEVPPIIKMFLNCGYLDEELAGIDNAVYLYELAENLPSCPEKGVYSMFEWLLAIYNGKKDPGRNEFDVDFADYLHEEMRNKRITKAQEQQVFADPLMRVRYELENVFPSVNKTTTGRITTFCPLFSEHNVLKSPENMLVTADAVTANIKAITDVDFGAYYRQTVFSSPEEGVSKEFINVEILPDIILAPNIGNRGIMWQEIEGKRRTTPARMFLSIFQQEDVGIQLIRLTGQFRWEMCKRVQGARWNDITERSLTSEYFDYVQYYRKNNDLSPDAKDKIKNDMARCKNSFREMFIRDYLVWIQFESQGAPRLNKVSRNLLFTYVPFSAACREKLKINPMYKDMIEHYEVKQKAKIHRLENFRVKLKNMGKGMPKELLDEMEFIKA